MNLDKEKAHIMKKLFRKGNWGACYDREEHFKRFSKESIKDLIKKRWVLSHKKPKIKAYSLNPKYKTKVLEFIEKNLPELRGSFK